MTAIIFPLITIIFLGFVMMLLPNVKLENFMPVGISDIGSIVMGNMGVIGLWVYVFFLFILGDKIEEKQNIKKQGWITGVFLTIVTVLCIGTSVGTLGYSIIRRAPMSFYIAVKEDLVM